MPFLVALKHPFKAALKHPFYLHYLRGNKIRATFVTFCQFLQKLLINLQIFITISV